MRPCVFWGQASQPTATCWSSTLSHHAALPAAVLLPAWQAAIFVLAHAKSSTFSAVGSRSTSVSLYQLRMPSSVQRTTNNAW